VLFDEVEKAHPDVFNLLLQVLDDGRLTDSKGHTVDFKNTIIVLTSNIGSEILSRVDQLTNQDRAHVMDMVQRSFRPEFLNRLDEILIFQKLLYEDIKMIVELQLRQFKERLKVKRIDLEWDKSALDLLAHFGYDPAYGARPLRRVLQRSVQDLIAKRLLEDNLITEDSVVKVRLTQHNNTLGVII